MVKGTKVVGLVILTNHEATSNLECSQLGGAQSYKVHEIDMPMGGGPSCPGTKPL